jgi:hypothetical protein
MVDLDLDIRAVSHMSGSNKVFWGSFQGALCLRCIPMYIAAISH